jgi:hypothetical protein
MSENSENQNKMTAEKFKEILLSADWYYQYAGGSAYTRGRDSVSVANQAYYEMKKIDPIEAERLWIEYGNK